MQDESRQKYPRAPGIDGKQLGDVFFPVQPSNCVNDSSVKVPPLQRCWAHRGTYIDMAVLGAELDKYGKTTPSQIIVRLLWDYYLCETMMSDECVHEMGALGCAFYTFSNLDPPGVPPGSTYNYNNTSSQGVAVKTQTSITGGYGSGPPTSQSRRGGSKALGVGLGVSLGGTALLVLMFVAAVAVVRLRIHQRQPLHRTGQIGGDVVDGAVGHLPQPAFFKADERMDISSPLPEGCKPSEDLNSGAGTSSAAKTSPDGACASTGGLSILLRPEVEPQQVESDCNSNDNGTCNAGQGLKVDPTGIAAEEQKPLAGVVVTSQTPHRPDVNLNLVLRELQQEKQHHSQPSEEISNTRNLPEDPDAHALGQTKLTVCSSGAVGDAHGAAAPASFIPAATAEVVLLPTVRGKGSFGRVVEGMYQGQKVAVKLMNEGLAPFGASLGVRDVIQLQTLGQEVEVLARCCHPNVVRLLAACVTPPSLCLVMELMDTSLEQLIQRAPGHLLPMSTVLQIAVDVARGLEYLHPTIVHRDLKPANVLVNDPLGPKQVAKLTDFGLARLHNSAIITTSPEAGTPPYMAPECFDALAESLTHQMDMYSLGMLLWAMLSGMQPWQGFNMVQIACRVTLGGERPPLSAVPPGRRPHKLLRLMQDCWEADPRRRPAAAEAVKELMLVQQMARP
ncbi:hypothetical protein Vafri_3574 [Volvox africanus]|nr:hypothetical protein Vafri_3574 [Volvox africanus]